MTYHYLLMANQAIVQRRLMEALKSTGLTSGQPKILDYLKDYDGAAQKDIAAYCYIEPATITSLLNGMESKGLIERRRLDGNRRSFYIFLTEKGKRLQKKVDKIFSELEEEAFLGVPKEKRIEFMKLFQEIHQKMT